MLKDSQKEKAVEVAEGNTKRNEDGLTVIEKDDIWRETDATSS
jgi:hypothetical protein